MSEASTQGLPRPRAVPRGRAAARPCPLAAKHRCPCEGRSRRCGAEMTDLETTSTLLEPEALDVLVDVLRSRGYRVLGPQVRDGAIVYDDLAHASDLPIG